MVRFFNLPNSLTYLFNTLLTITPTLISQVGYLPVYRVYRRIGTLIDSTTRTIQSRARTVGSSVRDSAIQAITPAILEGIFNANPGFNPIVVREIIRYISPYIEESSSHIAFLKLFFKIFLFLFTLGMFRPVFLIIIRPMLSIIFSSLCIMYNEVLSGLVVLKDFSDYVIDSLECYTGFRFPRPSFRSTVESSNDNFIMDGHLTNENLKVKSYVEDVEDVVQESSINKYYKWTGYAVLFVIAVTTTLVLGDNIHATTELVHKLPFVDSVLNPIYNLYHGIANVITSMFGSNPPTGGTGSASTSGTATPITIGDNTTSSITRVMHSSTESNLDPNILFKIKKYIF